MDSLTEELGRLWNLAGRPSSRALANLTDRTISHSTVADLLTGKAPRPRWASVLALATVLDDGGNADMDLLARLWRTQVERHDDPRSPVRPATRTDAINNLAAAINNLADAIRDNAGR